MTKQRLLDLFSGSGGAARGYQMAGFHVTGIDIKKMPRYAGDVFIQADALEYVAEHGHEFDAIHASPPCQGYSVTNNIWGNDHPMLIEATRKALIATGKPYVIENVPGAPLINPVELDGIMFGLATIRKRLFETSFFMLCYPSSKRPPAGCTNANRGYSSHKDGATFISVAGHNFNRVDGANAMGIDWPMTREEVAQSIPPAYTHFIGQRLLETMTVTA